MASVTISYSFCTLVQLYMYMLLSVRVLLFLRWHHLPDLLRVVDAWTASVDADFFLARLLLGRHVRTAETVPNTLHLARTSFVLVADTVICVGGAARLSMSANCWSTAPLDIEASSCFRFMDISMFVLSFLAASLFLSSPCMFSESRRHGYEVIVTCVPPMWKWRESNAYEFFVLRTMSCCVVTTKK